MAGIRGSRPTRQSERLQTRFIDSVIQNNPKARANPKALAQLDGYKRPLVSFYRDSIDHPPCGNDDMANAWAGAIWLVSEHTGQVFAPKS